MDATWLSSWLCYVHVDQHAPAPGPCRNDRLVEWNPTLQKWTGRPDLVMATVNRHGDYRRVSEKAWRMYQQLYPNSGPSICVNFKPDPAHRLDGRYDTTNWVVDLPPPAAKEQIIEKKFGLHVHMHMPVFTSKKTAESKSEGEVGAESKAASPLMSSPSGRTESTDSIAKVSSSRSPAAAARRESLSAAPRSSFLGSKSVNTAKPVYSATGERTSSSEGVALIDMASKGESGQGPSQRGGASASATTPLKSSTPDVPTKRIERRGDDFYNGMFFDNDA